MRRETLPLFLFLAACGKRPEIPRAVEAPRPTKITHFYGNALSIVRGETLTLCYGTENATTVSITPPIETDLRPSINRCIGDTPTKDTTYALKASGPGGDVAESFRIKVDAPPKPLITSFLIQGDPVRPRGARVGFCYHLDRPASVSISPPISEPLQSCFETVVDKTTTFILTATAPDGTVDRVQNTITVR